MRICPPRLALGSLLSSLAMALSCNGTTGYDLVAFDAGASGASDATKGHPYAFDSAGVHVTLTRATLHIGALYLTQSVPQAGGGPSPCTLPGTQEGVFVGEVRDGGADIDLLDPAVQLLPVRGDGTTIPAVTGQVWLMHGDVNAENDAAVLVLQGTFVSAGQSHTFYGAITIDASRQAAATNSALPGEHPICKLRIVSAIPVALTLAAGGTLVVRIDPKSLLNGLTLSQLPACPGSTPAERCFSNDDSNQPSVGVFENLTSTATYRFAWLPPAP